MNKCLLVLASFALLGLNCLGVAGCTTPGPQDWEQTMQAIQVAREIAQDTGTAFVVSASWNGKLTVWEKVEFGFGSGVDLRMQFHGNAARSFPDAP